MAAFIALIFGLIALYIIIKLWYVMWKVALVLLFLAIILLFCCGVNGYAKECSPAEIVMIGKVVHHEAGNQSELGKRLVADTILNRVDSEKFPNTVEEVISQPGQYCDTVIYPPKDVYRLVAEEMYHRTNSDVLYFKTGGYHKFGVPILKEGKHYFSGRIE